MGTPHVSQLSQPQPLFVRIPARVVAYLQELEPQSGMVILPPCGGVLLVQFVLLGLVVIGF